MSLGPSIKGGALMANRKPYLKLFTFSGFSPILSHGIVFLGGMCLAFDLIHLTVVPMKIASGHVIFSEKSERIHTGDSDWKIGDLLHLQKVLNEETSPKCRVGDSWARVIQIEGGLILGSDSKNFVNYVERLKDSGQERLVWGLTSESTLDICREQLTVQYGM